MKKNSKSVLIKHDEQKHLQHFSSGIFIISGYRKIASGLNAFYNTITDQEIY